jgi:hypothetical protein
MLTKKEKEKRVACIVKEDDEKHHRMIEAGRTALAAPTLLQPAASDEELVAAFKRYVALKEKLLENDDYVWIVFYKVGDKEERKFFPFREEAEAFAKQLEERKIKARLEKKVKKSGCLKLGKAFSISVEIIERVPTISAEPALSAFFFRVRANAPNGQSMERTGRCDRAEKGRKESPLDHLEATALTRASNRAIMALLGGETTAEEFGEEIPPNDATTSSSKPPKAATEGRGASSDVAAKHNADAPDDALPTHEEKIAEIDKHFGTAKAAKTERVILMRKMFAMAKDADVSEEELDKKVKARFRVYSKAQLTEKQLLVVIGSLQRKIAANERS